MRRRTKARELAVQFLYHLDLRGDEVAVDLHRFLDAAEVENHIDGNQRPEGHQPKGMQTEGGTSPRVDKGMREFAVRLIEGTRRHQEDADKILATVTRNWDLRRMATVDRNILRMAIHELLHCPDIPPKVTINEAIELGKRFSTANSGAFINGILDRIRLDIDKGVVAAPAASQRRTLEQER